MRYRKYFARRWVAPLFLLVTLAVIARSACGTRGNPPALGKPVQVTLSSSVRSSDRSIAAGAVRTTSRTASSVT